MRICSAHCRSHWPSARASKKGSAAFSEETVASPRILAEVPSRERIQSSARSQPSGSTSTAALLASGDFGEAQPAGAEVAEASDEPACTPDERVDSQTSAGGGSEARHATSHRAFDDASFSTLDAPSDAPTRGLMAALKRLLSPRAELCSVANDTRAQSLSSASSARLDSGIHGANLHVYAAHDAYCASKQGRDRKISLGMRSIRWSEICLTSSTASKHRVRRCTVSNVEAPSQLFTVKCGLAAEIIEA